MAKLKQKDEKKPAKLPEGATRITGPRPIHDKNTCRLYGCLACQAAGVKNEKRGLT